MLKLTKNNKKLCLIGFLILLIVILAILIVIKSSSNSSSEEFNPNVPRFNTNVPEYNSNVPTVPYDDKLIPAQGAYYTPNDAASAYTCENFNNIQQSINQQRLQLENPPDDAMRDHIQQKIDALEVELNSFPQEIITECNDRKRYELHEQGPSLSEQRRSGQYGAAVKCIGTGRPWSNLNIESTRPPYRKLVKSDPCLAYTNLQYLRTWTPFIKTILANQDYFYPKAQMIYLIRRARFGGGFAEHSNINRYNLKKMLATRNNDFEYTFRQVLYNPKFRWYNAGSAPLSSRSSNLSLGEELGQNLNTCMFPTNIKEKNHLYNFNIGRTRWQKKISNILELPNNNIKQIINNIVNNPSLTERFKEPHRIYKEINPDNGTINHRTIIHGMMRVYFLVINEIVRSLNPDFCFH